MILLRIRTTNIHVPFNDVAVEECPIFTPALPFNNFVYCCLRRGNLLNCCFEVNLEYEDIVLHVIGRCGCFAHE
jgi:hypothetical protein